MTVWMVLSNLKNRVLQGEEILSQVSVDDDEDGEEGDEEEEAEDSDVELGGDDDSE